MENGIVRRARYAALAILIASPIYAQAPGSAQARMAGVVSSVDVAAGQIALKTNTGDPVTVTMTPRVSFRRIAPGETDLRKAERIALADIAPGDRLLAVGAASSDKKNIAATLIVDMSKGDIANKRKAEQQDWEKRGVDGIVTAIGSDRIVIGVRGTEGRKPLVIVPAANAAIRRYSSDSIKFSDAKPSTLAEIKVGDQVRARGDKNEDGSKMTADEIVSGAFREIAATVISVDPAAKQVRVNDLATKMPLIVAIDAASNLRRLPEPMAQMLAARNRPQPSGERADAAPRVGFGQGGRASGDLNQMLDRVPVIALADLKKGDAVIVLSTVGAAQDELNAITLLAGVEPILTKPGTREMSLGSWSLGNGIGGGDAGDSGN